MYYYKELNNQGEIISLRSVLSPINNNNNYILISEEEYKQIQYILLKDTK